MIATKKAKLIRKHLGENTPEWIVKNCIALLKEYEEIEWCDVQEEQANGDNTENEPSINYEPLLYTVHVICWDGVQYDRKADKEEIDRMRAQGYVKKDGYTGTTFDFR